MKKYLIFAVAAILSLQIMAASLGNINGTYWHDGFAFYKVTEEAGIISFTGGTLHEGGYGFNVVKGNGGKMIVQSIYDAMETITTPGQSVSGSTIERSTVNGNDVLIIKSPEGNVTDVLLAMKDDFENVLEEQLNQQLDGVYRDSSGKYYSFDGYGKLSIGTSQPKWKPYKFIYIYESPSNIIDYPALNKHFAFNFKGQNIKLDEVKTINGEGWDDEPEVKPVKTTIINKLKGNRYTGNGLWPITSAEILSSGYFECYDVEELRLMRNDIYARHGYIFKDKSLRKIFGKQSWYKPTTSNASSLKLSEIEFINIALIQNMEKVKSRFEK